MTFDDYQKQAVATAIYPEDLKIIYPAIGLSGELGEVMEHVKKMTRDDNRVLSPARREALAKEIGDVLWYMANLAQDAGLSLSDIAQRNVQKIQDRQARHVQHGDGDNR